MIPRMTGGISSCLVVVDSIAGERRGAGEQREQIRRRGRGEQISDITMDDSDDCYLDENHHLAEDISSPPATPLRLLGIEHHLYYLKDRCF